MSSADCQAPIVVAERLSKRFDERRRWLSRGPRAEPSRRSPT